MRKSYILEELSRHGPYAVFPEVLKNKRIILWTLSRDFSGVNELNKYFLTLRREGLLLELGAWTSLAMASARLRGVREEAYSQEIRRLHLIPAKTMRQ